MSTTEQEDADAARRALLCVFEWSRIDQFSWNEFCVFCSNIRQASGGARPRVLLTRVQEQALFMIPEFQRVFSFTVDTAPFGSAPCIGRIFGVDLFRKTV